MDPDGGSAGSSYYAVLGIGRDASFSDVRSAYRKLAMKWHPDRWASNPAVAADVKQRFQKIQEAYSVLSDASKKSVYDAGLYDPLEEDQGSNDFMREMVSMMNSVRNEPSYSLEDLQKMFMEMVGGDVFSSNHGGGGGGNQTASKRARVTVSNGGKGARRDTTCQ